MSSLPVTMQNTVTFTTLANLDVLGYNLNVQEVLEDGTTNIRLLQFFPNPSAAQEITFVHTTSLESQYYVEPVFNRTHSIGNHNVLQ